MELDVTALFRAHAGFVERVLRRAGVAERDLGDATQEVFVVVHRRASEFEGRANPRTWLYRIAWNVASETRRRAFRRRELLETPSEPISPEPSAAERVETRLGMAALLDAIDRLDPDKREALICHELDEQPMATVASRLGIPLKTAFSRLYAARRALALDMRKRGWACVPAWWWPSARFSERVAGEARSAGWLTMPSPLVLALAAMSVLNPHESLQPKAALDPASATAPPLAAEVQLAIAATDPRPVSAAPGPAAKPVARAAARRPRAQPRPPAPAQEASTPKQTLVVVHTGQFDLGAGPFGTSPLSDPPLVEPQRHPRAEL